MRTFLSRVEHVLDVADRGCVIAPGIPRSSNAQVKVGDCIWLTRPDGSEVSTLIHGVGIGGGNPEAGIPILLGSELTRDDIPLETSVAVEVAPTQTIVIHAHAEQLIELASVFTTTEQGQLCFGWSARSQRRNLNLADLLSGDVEFIDYVMEGFVSYHLNAEVRGNLLLLTLNLHGSNRDRYVESQVLHYLRAAGLTTTSIERRTVAHTAADDPCES